MNAPAFATALRILRLLVAPAGLLWYLIFLGRIEMPAPPLLQTPTIALTVVILGWVAMLLHGTTGPDTTFTYRGRRLLPVVPKIYRNLAVYLAFPGLTLLSITLAADVHFGVAYAVGWFLGLRGGALAHQTLCAGRMRGGLFLVTLIFGGVVCAWTIASELNFQRLEGTYGGIGAFGLTLIVIAALLKPRGKVLRDGDWVVVEYPLITSNMRWTSGDDSDGDDSDGGDSDGGDFSGGDFSGGDFSGGDSDDGDFSDGGSDDDDWGGDGGSSGGGGASSFW